MAHKFKLRQRVRVSLQAATGTVLQGGSWEVVRLMPADQTGEYHYRVKGEGAERAASERDLQLA